MRSIATGLTQAVVAGRANLCEQYVVSGLENGNETQRALLDLAQTHVDLVRPDDQFSLESLG
ncbi:hypothetical protein FJ964_03145 [Mesorhizobium sp. B2-3-2]|nr:hypothetical protein FJ964_03145 [Mesorhizobium sp. B2-3-2]